MAANVYPLDIKTLPLHFSGNVKTATSGPPSPFISYMVVGVQNVEKEGW